MVENKDSFLADLHLRSQEEDSQPENRDDSTSVTTPLLSAVAVAVPVNGQGAAAAPLPRTNPGPAPMPSAPLEELDIALTEEQQQQQRQRGAGIASGVVGLLLGGPILALLFGFGAAYAADQEGVAGDAARAIGDLALQARIRARDINEKHKVADQAQEAAGRLWNRAQEMDREHRLWDRAVAFASTTFTQASDFCHRHRVVERGIDAIGRAAYWVGELVASKIAAASESAGQTQHQQPSPQYPAGTVTGSPPESK